MIIKCDKAWRFRVRFADSTLEYWSPDVRRSDPGWGGVDFGRAIASIDFHLPTGHVLRLTGMEAYCFFVEASQSLGGRDGAKIEAFWFCGRLPRRGPSRWVDMWRVADGQVMRCRKPYGAEWGGAPIAGWKPGTVGGRVFSGIVGGGG